MSKPILKSRILLGKKLLGSLIYTKDKEGRGYLKLSFKNKLGGFSMWTDDKELAKLPVLPASEEDVSFDISYKFNDNKLEIKRQIGNKITPIFRNVPFPPNHFLFLLKIKDWHILEDADITSDSLTINLPNQNNSVAVFFSFLGQNGLPFAPDEYLPEMGRTVCADLPERILNKICIGTVEDKENNEEYNLVVKIPAHPQTVNG